MPKSEMVVGTPYFVLMDGHHRIGPKVTAFPSEVKCPPIYGFSGKGPYDKFCESSHLVLKPYPLLKLYLRDQIGADGDSLKLVVIDAAGPREPSLHAATMEAVLDALENRSTEVPAAQQLLFDQEADAYRVEEEFV